MHRHLAIYSQVSVQIKSQPESDRHQRWRWSGFSLFTVPFFQVSLHLFLVCVLLSTALFFFWSPGVRGLFLPALYCVFCSISLSSLLDPVLFHLCPPFLVIFYTLTSTKPQYPLGRGGPFSVGHLLEGQVDFSLHAGSETCSELLGLNFQRMANIRDSSRSGFRDVRLRTSNCLGS